MNPKYAHFAARNVCQRKLQRSLVGCETGIHEVAYAIGSPFFSATNVMWSESRPQPRPPTLKAASRRISCLRISPTR